MQISQRLKINAIVSAITAFVILLILSLALYRLNNENDKGKIAGEILTGTFEVIELKNDYIWNRNERAKEQWITEHEQLGRLLKSASEKFRKPEDIKILTGMIKDYESIGEIFAGIMENRQKAGLHVYSADLSRAIESRLLRQLHIRSYEFAVNVRHLLESNRESRDSALRLAAAGIVFIIMILVVATLINSLMVGRTIIDRIRRLRDGALLIGDGTLDHKVEVKGDDEFTELAEGFNTMTAKLKQAQDKIVGLAAIVEFSTDAIISATLDGIIVSWNPGAEKLYGYSSREAIGRSITLLTQPDRSDEISTIFDKIRNGEIITAYDTSRMRKDGTLVDVSLTVSPVKDSTGKIVGASGIARNVTDRKKLEERLKRYSKELEQSNRELDKFASIAAHDLGAPIRAVSGFARLLQKRCKEKLGADADQYISNIIEGTGRMENLIIDLLNYARAGARDKPLLPVDVNAIIEKTLANLAFEIQESEAVITVDPLPTVSADSTQLIQLFQNLVGNAIKFCRTTPRIHISADRKQGEWLFLVSDNGIGIDLQHAERIFQIFQRLHARDKFSGTGIGLAICKKIVEMLGGRIWVESKPGEGSTFYFTLPIAEP
ncbi:MAG TPA: ATP-binding protein [Dissulfurispiraceae bacterium]|nr:ATP-binding protein [Dissulfurispiraceae bacterium]